MKNKQCAACGYIRQSEDLAPEYECPKCKKIYAKTDASKIEELKKNTRIGTSSSSTTEPSINSSSQKRVKSRALLVTLIVLLGAFFTWNLARQHIDESSTISSTPNIVEEIRLKDGLVYEIQHDRPLTGTWLLKYPTGNEWFASEFKDGRPDGTLSLWYSNGIPAVKAEIDQNHMLNGDFQYWYEDGTPAFSGTYREDHTEGKASFWYPSGKEAIHISSELPSTKIISIFNKHGRAVLKSRWSTPSSILVELSLADIKLNLADFNEGKASRSNADIALLHCAAEKAVARFYADEISSGSLFSSPEFIGAVRKRYISALGYKNAASTNSMLKDYISIHAFVSHNVMRFGDEYSTDVSTPFKYSQYRGAVCAASNIWEFSLPPLPTVGGSHSQTVLDLLSKNIAYAKVAEDFVYSPSAVDLDVINQQIKGLGASVIQSLKNEIELRKSIAQ